MILGSYRHQFDNNIDYFVFKIVCSLNNYFYLQIFILKIIKFWRSSYKLNALLIYIYLINEVNYKKFDEKIKFNGVEWNDFEDLKSLFPKSKIERKNCLTDDEADGFRSPLIYKFDKSGFFSVIFTLININFYCESKKLALIIDDENWLYKFNLRNLFPHCFIDSLNIPNEHKYSGQDRLFEASRMYIKKIKVEDMIIYTQLNSYRQKIFKKLYIIATEHLKNSNININYYGVTCFIRRGDKLKNESYPLTLENYCKNLKPLKHNLSIIGDDYYFNEKISKNLKVQNIFIPGYKPRGAFLEESSDENAALNSILLNFKILCESEAVIGDANCNLVAAAMAYRGENYTHLRGLHPWGFKDFI